MINKLSYADSTDNIGDVTITLPLCISELNE